MERCDVLARKVEGRQMVGMQSPVPERGRREFRATTHPIHRRHELRGHGSAVYAPRRPSRRARQRRLWYSKVED